MNNTYSALYIGEARKTNEIYKSLYLNIHDHLHMVLNPKQQIHLKNRSALSRSATC